MRKPSPAEPVTELRRVRIVENGEPLVNFEGMCPKLLLSIPRFTYRRETYLRAGVAQRLCQATEYVPDGYRIAILEGWRPQHIQRRMYLTVWNRFKKRHPDWSDVQLKRVVNRFTAPLHDRVPPPHSTGGAIDVFLANEQGEELDMRSPYDWFDHAGYSLNAPGLTDEARRHRDILAGALDRAGITNYPSEFWHFSYGDQGWAYRGGLPNAIYGPITPEGYSPEPGDVTDEPLVYRTSRSR
jgi:D-alanyl-D-alanine dipeptidase